VEEGGCKRRGVNHSGTLPKCQLVIWRASAFSPLASRQDGVTAEPHDYNGGAQGNTIIVASAEYFDVEDK
jgi:hypothetical protein